MMAKRDPYDDLARELIQPERPRLVLTGTSTNTGIDIDDQDNAWNNPMSDEGDLIVGGEGGGPTRLGIGDVDQVLTSDGTTAYWADPTGGIAGGRYRLPIYTTYAGGALLFDTDGHMMYALEELE